VHALDLQSGCSYWSFRTDARVRAAVIVGPTRSGLAAFIGDQSATVYSVDTTTGQLRWKRKVEDHRASRITGGPVLYEGRLYVPVSSERGRHRGRTRLSVLHVPRQRRRAGCGNGRLLWKTYTISEAPIPTIKNSAGTQLYGPSGAAVWSAPTIDPTTRSIYVTTGDAYTAPAWTSTDAIMALDMNTGAIKWVKQLTGGDAWNMACGTGSPGKLPRRRRTRSRLRPVGDSRLVVERTSAHSWRRRKSGQIHAVDPDDRGRLLWSIKPAKGGMLGGFEWGSASDGQYFYAPTSDIAFKNPAVVRARRRRAGNRGRTPRVRVTDGSIAWSTPAPPCTAPCSPAQSAPAAVMPGVVFSRIGRRNLRAYPHPRRLRSSGRSTPRVRSKPSTV
jgi:polyvinyl alcohol dehydrogenase (cytochrome)